MKRDLPEKTTRGTKRKTKQELSESGKDAFDNMDDDDALMWSQNIKAGKRGYGDRLAEGFGMLGGD